MARRVVREAILFLHAEAARLAELWRTTPNSRSPFKPPREEYLPPLRPEAIRDASMSFSRDTAQTYDGFHPRHFCLLSLDQLEVVALLLHAVERHGRFPTAILAVVATLLKKAAAKQPGVPAFRSIGLLPALYRVWAKCRLPLAKDWEVAHPRPYLRHQKGRSITELVFQQALVPEAAAAEGRPAHSGALLWDMSDYYEHVQRPVLWERADRTHFPLSILAVVLNQHQAPRFVSYEGATVSTGHPGQGLAAGDPFDTYLVQVYTLEPLDAWQSKHRRLPLSLFIDDFQVGITDEDPEVVVRELTAGAEALTHVIENDLGCTVACRKSITLANSDGLRRKLAKALGSKAGQVAQSGKNLGVDFAGITSVADGLVAQC